MTEKIISVSLEDDNTVKTVKEIYEPRYVGYSEYSQTDCEVIIDDFKEQNKIWTRKYSREGFNSLSTDEDWEPEGKSVEKDIESFQKYLDETYGEGKYEAYALGAYVHSDVHFAFNKHEDTRCHWDSGTCGFVGINKELNVDLTKYASLLSEAWNGYIILFGVYDNYEEEIISEVLSVSPTKEINEWKERMKKEYNVTEYPQRN